MKAHILMGSIKYTKKMFVKYNNISIPTTTIKINACTLFDVVVRKMS